jgi:hypothetical protein
MNTTVPTKQAQFQAFLDRGSVFVHLDPRREGVEAPASVKARSRVVLQIRRALTIPLPDITVDADAVRVTLTFGGEPFRCTLPWGSMFSLVADDGEVTVWPLELPHELAPDRAPTAVGAGGRSVHPGHPVSLPPPAIGVARSRAPSRSPSRVPAELGAAPRPASVIPGSLAAALRIPRAPALPRALSIPQTEEPRREDTRRSDSTPAASRAMRVNDSMSLRPRNDRDDE